MHRSFVNPECSTLHVEEQRNVVLRGASLVVVGRRVRVRVRERGPVGPVGAAAVRAVVRRQRAPPRAPRHGRPHAAARARTVH